VTEELGPALTLGQMLDQAGARDPSHDAIVFRGERVSYGEVTSRAGGFPRTGSGKVRKVKQQACAVETYGLKAPA
jgi:hypothetical protein